MQSDRIETINQYRIDQGLSIQQVADMSQISASTVYRTLSGKTTPDEHTLRSMEDALGITDKPLSEPMFPPGSISIIAQGYINTLEVRIARLRAH